MAKRKLQTELSLQQKSEVLQRIQKGESQRKLAEQYGVSKTTIANIKKNEHSIINAVESNCSQNRKRKMKKTENEEVNNIILEFFIKCRAQNIPVTGPMLQAKAAEIASSLQIEKFTASNGWLEAFRRRNNINFRVLCGESANVDKEAADDWKRHLPAVVEGYAAEDQFNADETAVFYRQLPRKSMVFKGESCKGGKFAKERLSIMLCCSATGEKLKPLIIGNAARPRAFKQNSVTPDNLPVTWKHNKKAWMTTAVFEDWLNELNETMKKKKRRIILFVDNATSHVVSKKLSNVRVKFLPPHLTSELQPLDQGIIQAMKANYRKSMLHSLLTAVGKFSTATEFAKSVTVFDAIRWISIAWNNVQEETILKCFRRAGFASPETDLQEQQDSTSESDLVSALPEALQFEVASEDDILENEANIPVHENIACTAEGILEDIMTGRVQGTSLDDELEVEEEEADQQPLNPPPSHSDALQHVHSLMQFAETNLPHLQPTLINIYSEIERNWATANIQKKKQTTLHQFFTIPK